MAQHVPAPRLRAAGVVGGYDGRVVLDGVSLTVPPQQVTVVVGPNACGKSTLLRALGRLLRPAEGQVLLDGKAIHRLPTRHVARQVGLLPQAAAAPPGIQVVDLVSRGRTPHQRVLRQWSAADESAVVAALDATGTRELADRPVDELSGGQRQRVWLAMALAQQTDLLLLDEPTTFLDVAHQLEVLELIADLQRTHGRTVVAVLHDLDLAARYAHHLVAMRDGRIVTHGRPSDVITAEMVHDVFGVDAVIARHPVASTPLVLPVARAGSPVTRAIDPPRSPIALEVASP